MGGHILIPLEFTGPRCGMKWKDGTTDLLEAIQTLVFRIDQRIELNYCTNGHANTL